MAWFFFLIKKLNKKLIIYYHEKMKELEDLTEVDRTILFACCDANKFSLNSHVQLETITKRIKGISGKYIKKSIKLLISNGFIRIHPVSRSKKTYQLNKKGLTAGIQIRDNWTR